MDISPDVLDAVMNASEMSQEWDNIPNFNSGESSVEIPTEGSAHIISMNAEPSNAPVENSKVRKKNSILN